MSHAYAFGGMSDRDSDALAATLAEAGVAIVTGAVYDFPVPPVKKLRAAGVTVACGHDGIRDLWGPYGSGDMLERARQVAYRNTFRRDDDIELALHAATYGGRALLGLPCRAPGRRVAGRPGRRRRTHRGGGRGDRARAAPGHQRRASGEPGAWQTDGVENSALSTARCASALLNGLSDAELELARGSLDDPRLTEWSYLPGDRPGLPVEGLSAAQHDLVVELLRSAHSSEGGDLAVGVIEVNQVRGGNWRPAHRPTVTGTGCGCSATRTAPSPGAGGSTATTWPCTSVVVSGGTGDGHASLRRFGTGGRTLGAVRRPPDPRPRGRPGPPTGDRGSTRTSARSASAPTWLPTTYPPGPTRWPIPHCCPRGIGRDLLRSGAAGGPRPAGPALPQPGTGGTVGDPRMLARRRDGGAYRGFPGSRGRVRRGAPGQGHYCVRAPQFLIEYDNTQDDANHAHSVWRHLRHDWGSDPASRSLRTAPRLVVSLHQPGHR